MKILFLFGHRDCPPSAFHALYDAIEAYVQEQEGEQICVVVGHRGAFDSLATYTTILLKSRFPQICLLQLIAYYDPKNAPFRPDGVDGTYYPEGMERVPKPFAIVKANEAVLAECDAVICYVCHTASNTQELLKKAMRKDIPVVNIADAEW